MSESRPVDGRLVRAREYIPTMIEAHRTVPPVVVHWSAALDNYEPTRAYMDGYAVSYMHDGEIPALVLWHGGEPRDPHRCNFIVDDGKTVTPMYAAGWLGGDDDGRLFLHQFPVNPDGRTVEQHGQAHVIDYRTWMLGPRVTYHLKVSPVPNGI